ncbi:MAG: hypothetical protein U1E17_20525 [Geminicoccaceae bacterium]
MMDPVSLATATTTVGLVGPYLAEGGKEVAKSAARDVYDWLKRRLTGPAAEALGDVERDPASELDRADLVKRLAKALAADPALLQELAALLPAEAKGDVQQLDQTGSFNKAVQNRGSNNTITIS